MICGCSALSDFTLPDRTPAHFVARTSLREIISAALYCIPKLRQPGSFGPIRKPLAESAELNRDDCIHLLDRALASACGIRLDYGDDDTARRVRAKLYHVR